MPALFKVLFLTFIMSGLSAAAEWGVIHIADLKKEHPRAMLRQVSPAEYMVLAAAYSEENTAAFHPGNPESASDSGSSGLETPIPAADSAGTNFPMCLGLDSAGTLRYKDSVTAANLAEAERELEKLRPQQAPPPPQGTIVHSDRTAEYVGEFVVDIAKKQKKTSEKKSDDNDLAVIIFVAVGVVVVSAFVIVGGKFLYDMIYHGKKLSYWRDAGFSYTFSTGSVGREFAEGYFRHSHHLSGRISLGMTKKIVGLGITCEAGYVDVRIRNELNPLEFFQTDGYFALFGPVFRIGGLSPLTVDLEFLNGTSNRESIGWITKSNVLMRFRMDEHFWLGAHFGALHMDLDHMDGLLIKHWKLNRDFSMLYGINAGFSW